MMIDRIQRYFHQAAAARYQAFTIPPFTLYIHSSDVPYFNYAIPTGAPGAEIGAALAELRRVCQERHRKPRIEYVIEFAPDLAAALLAHGFAEKWRYPLLLCDEASWKPAPPVAGLMMMELNAASPDGLMRTQLEIGARGFDPAAPPANDEHVQGLRRDIAGGARPFLALLDDTPVAVGTLASAADGMVELAGITTLVRYRRRGIAAAITSHLARAAFDAGQEYAVLMAVDENASRLYQRSGFRIVATVAAFSS